MGEIPRMDEPNQGWNIHITYGRYMDEPNRGWKYGRYMDKPNPGWKYGRYMDEPMDDASQGWMMPAKIGM